ncbi:hypothetical protein [Sinorhizobium chiapasense]|uniref:Uncharacterized protein n=1 Tax=Sinorhizobium chiapasense TaxID=501572 RepID=A0ABZ2BGA4_9HYPH
MSDSTYLGPDGKEAMPPMDVEQVLEWDGPYYIDGSNHTVGETGGADTFVYKSDSGVDTTADFG